MRRSAWPVFLAAFLTIGLAATGLRTAVPAAAADDCANFPQTGHSVCGAFLQYWEENGGLAQQGYPLTDTFTETSTADGRTYTVQYFERAVFELHPDAINTPYYVQLSLLGRNALRTRYPNGAPAAGPNLPGDCATFAATGQTVCGAFLTYWENNGDLAQQGYPLTGVFNEKSAVDGQTYQVQYFERTVMELHPELAAPSNVLLSQLGRAQLAARYPNGVGGGDTAFISPGQLTVTTNGNNYVEWTLPVKDISSQPLLSVTVLLIFLDANGQQLDQSLAGGANIAPGETRILHGLSFKGLGYKSYQLQPPQVTVQAGG
jgi:hypothetical protein